MRIKRCIGEATTVALVTAVVAAPPAAAGDEGFVLRRDGSKAVPVVAPEPGPPSDAFDWGDAGIGAGAGAAALLVAAAGAQFARRRRTARSPLPAVRS